MKRTELEWIKQAETPAYVTVEREIRRNMQILREVADRAGCRILLAQKAFSMFSLYPVMAQYLAGTTASGLYEARLGRECFGGETHVFSPAYKEEELKELLSIADHIVFNSMGQWRRFSPLVRERQAQQGREGKPKISAGLRINPEYSEIETDLYNPCFAGSRLGACIDQVDWEHLEGIDGLHFHTMCEQGADVFARTVAVIEEKLGDRLSGFSWLNFGGGHHITKEGYDTELLVRTVSRIRDRYGVQVYLEPGEACALNAGYLIATVLDTVENGIRIAILDASAACHMPDVLEMPYRPEIIGAGMPGEKAYTYRLGGPTCLAGDVIGDYSFDAPLQQGDKLVFCDMAIYSMVKNNTFNGMKLPDIDLLCEDGTLKVVKRFGYEDFKGRLS